MFKILTSFTSFFLPQTDACDEVLFVNFDLASEMKNTDLCKQQIDYCLKLYDGLEKDRTIHDLVNL